MLRRWFWPLLLLAAVLLPGAAFSQPAPHRIVAIGDLHGDNDAWLAIAKAAGLIDAKGRWAGGTTTLVQMGDVVDRGPDSLKIIHHLQKLQHEAPRRGGKVIALLGNHEAMLMTRDYRYVHPGEYAVFADKQSEARREKVYEANKAAIEAAYRKTTPNIANVAIRDAWMRTKPLGMLEYEFAWSPQGALGKWALGNPAVARLGDTLFVHGGISSAFASLPVEEINRQVAASLAARDESPTAIVNNPQGPLWYRGLIGRGDGDAATNAPVPAGASAPLTIEQEIDLVLQKFGVKRIVVAHTPAAGIIEGVGGKLWRIDSGNSRAYNGTPSYLEIVGEKVTPHKVARPAGGAWK